MKQIPTTTTTTSKRKEGATKKRTTKVSTRGADSKVARRGARSQQVPNKKVSGHAGDEQILVTEEEEDLGNLVSPAVQELLKASRPNSIQKTGRQTKMQPRNKTHATRKKS